MNTGRADDGWCRHCPDTPGDHKYVCDCGHQHDAHVNFGPCKHSKCSCDGYSQKKQNTVYGKDVRNKGIAIPTRPAAASTEERMWRQAAVGGVILP